MILLLSDGEASISSDVLNYAITNDVIILKESIIVRAVKKEQFYKI